MPASPYFPSTETGQLPWFGNLRTKIGNAGNQAACGANAGDATTVQGICTLWIYILETWLPAIRQENEAWTQVIEQARSGTGGIITPAAPSWNPPAGSASLVAGQLDELFRTIARWKTAPGCSDSVQQDLGIKGTTTGPTTDAPELKYTVSPDGVTVTFKKLGHMGVYLETRRQGAESWVFLAIDTASPYLDERPPLVAGQSEWREYRARYWDGTPVGEWSGAIRANVG